MSQAVISDIHSNYEALVAVLEDIKSLGIDNIICLGDIIGYGPNPRECIDLARKFRVTTLGNHDEAALFEREADFFNKKARQALDWTRYQLEDLKDYAGNCKRWEFIGELPHRYTEDGVLFVHASPRSPVKEYIFPEIVNVPERLADIFTHFETICFVGHTHIPGVFLENSSFYRPEDMGDDFYLDGQKAIVNVGSVGQPRDGNNKACYVVFDGREVEYRRVEYDFKKTMQKIRAIDDLDDVLASRLAEGR